MTLRIGMLLSAISGQCLFSDDRRKLTFLTGNGSGGRTIPIPTALKHILVRLALRLLKGLGVVKDGLVVFFTYGLGKPLSWIGRGLFRLILLPLYRQYISLKQQLKTHPRLAGVRHFGHFVERYAVYAVLIVIGSFVIGNNILARTIRPDEIGLGAPWSTFAKNEASDLIVETAASQPITARQEEKLAVGGVDSSVATITTITPTVSGGTGGPLTDAVGGPPAIGTDTDTGNRQSTVSYTVQSGDTLSTIAHSFGLTSKTLLWANGLSNADFIKPGQVLKIPPEEGYLYTVQKGDTLAGIVNKYGGTQDGIMAANQLATADAIQPGTDIIIPGGQPPAPPTPAPTGRQTILNQVFTGNTGSPSSAPPSVPATGARFAWPTTDHRINQYFRGAYHTGVDIGGHIGNPIYAAASGRVIYAAYDNSGYGLHVVIDHGNGYSTLYAHASKIFVGVGDRVTQGQTIALIGVTGRSTGPHLHFEIRVGGGFLNPLSFF